MVSGTFFLWGWSIFSRLGRHFERKKGSEKSLFIVPLRSVSSRRRSQGSRIHLDEGGRSQGSRIHLNEGGRSHGSRIHIDEGVCSQGSRIHLDEGVRSQGSGIHPDEGGRSQGSRTYQDDGDFDPFDFPPKRKRKQQKSAFNETAFY